MILNTPGMTVSGELFHEPLVLDAPGIRVVGCRSWDVNPTDFLIELTPNASNCAIEGYIGVGNQQGQRAGIKVHAAGLRLVGSQFLNILRPPTFGFTDVQAIGGYAHTKDLRVADCVFQASTEVCMWGGADAPTEADIPQGIEFSRCVFTKLPGWRNVPGSVKNIFELKNVRGCALLDCLLEYSWPDAQVGFGIVLTVRNQDGANPWATIEDVLIRNCRMRYVAGGFNILARDTNHPSQRMSRVTIEDFLIEDMSPHWGSNGKTFQIIRGPDQLTLRRVGVKGTDIGTIMSFDGEPCDGFRVEGCNFDEGFYGIHSSDAALGVPTLEKYAPGYHWAGNTVRTRRAETGRVIQYPADTVIIPA